MKPMIVIVEKKDKNNLVMTSEKLSEYLEEAYTQGYTEGYAAGSKGSLNVPASPSIPSSPFYPGVTWGNGSIMVNEDSECVSVNGTDNSSKLK